MMLASATATGFFSGAAAMASVCVAAFFLRFWQESRDRFFALFALAFAAFAVNRLVLVFISDDAENRGYVYVIRLVAFVLILVAIIEKNRANR